MAKVIESLLHEGPERLRLADVEGCLTLMAAFFPLDKERTMATAVIPERGRLKWGAGAVAEQPGRLRLDAVDIWRCRDCLRLEVGGRDFGMTDPREGSREDECYGWYTRGNLMHAVDD